MRQIGIVIPTYNRPDITFDVFSSIHDDSRIKSITISDDCSTKENALKLKENSLKYPKSSVVFSISNLDCYFNKQRAIWLSQEPWNALIDSDNKIDKTYLDKLFEIDEWQSDTIYTPSWAYPQFDFRNYSGLTITKENIALFIDRPMFETMLNACNFFVNKIEYLDVFDASVDPVTSDSIYFSYCWLRSGRKIYIVPGLQYDHKVWEGSHYRTQNHRTPKGFHQTILNKLRELK